MLTIETPERPEPTFVYTWPPLSRWMRYKRRMRLMRRSFRRLGWSLEAL